MHSGPRPPSNGVRYRACTHGNHFDMAPPPDTTSQHLPPSCPSIIVVHYARKRPSTHLGLCCLWSDRETSAMPPACIRTCNHPCHQPNNGTTTRSDHILRRVTVANQSKPHTSQSVAHLSFRFLMASSSSSVNAATAGAGAGAGAETGAGAFSAKSDVKIMSALLYNK